MRSSCRLYGLQGGSQVLCSIGGPLLEAVGDKGLSFAEDVRFRFYSLAVSYRATHGKVRPGVLVRRSRLS